MGMIITFPLLVFAYSESTTHPALTNEIIKFFNIHHLALRLTEVEKELVVQGSIDEDEGIRFMHHFYDPVYDRGLMLVQEWQSSKEWSQDTVAQVGIIEGMLAGSLQAFFSGRDDYSWERGIYEYAWGDKERGLLALGHVLHLLEDAAVPDHTRNDPHPPILDFGSPYEFWTKKFDVENISVVNELGSKKPILLPDLNSYFNTIAVYSNNNFFSKDTIFIKDYGNPTIVEETRILLSDNKFYRFGLNRDSEENFYKLVVLPNSPTWRENIEGAKLTIDDADNLILSDYWNLLSKQAVVYGAGVVKLFFDEVEKERETKVLYKKNRSWFGKIFDLVQEKIRNLFGSTQQLTASVVQSQSQNESLAVEEESGEILQESEPGETVTGDVLGLQEATEIPIEETENPEEELQSEAPEESVGGVGPGFDEGAFNHIPNPYSPGFGGGGGNRNNNPPSLEATEVQDNNNEISEDIISPDPPQITSPTNESWTFTAVVVSFSGTAEASSTLEAIYLFDGATTTATTTADIDGLWNLDLIFNESSTTVNFFATDISGNKSEATSVAVFIDSLAPPVTLMSQECQDSLAILGCLTATTTLNFSWSSSANDVDFFVLDQNGEMSTTTATSTTVITQNNSTYLFSVSVRDTVGNVSATSTQEVQVATRPVVINEIAWMGTATSSADEWIELANTTNREISLEGWVLRAQDGVPYLTLQATIPANGFYLIERSVDNNTISNITADLAVPFSGMGSGSGLGNGGEHLFLERISNGATTTIDEVPECKGKWCAGSSKSKHTMERYDPSKSAIEKSNWGTALGEFILNGEDADGGKIKGTPKAKNSISYQIANGSILTEDKTLLASSSPYLIVRSGFTVQPDVTLTIEPGVVVKFVLPNEPSLVIKGTIVAGGIEESPVVFTAFADDAYGGDMNSDATSTMPTPGSWKQILIKETSQNSSFTNTIIRYGGRWFNNMTLRGAVAVNGTNVTFQNITIEHAQKHGLYLKNSGSIITNSIFQNNNTDFDAAGVYINGGSPEISGSTFENNKYGLYIVGASGLNASSNTFTNNTNDAVKIFGTVGILSSNSGSGNGFNAIVLESGAVTEANATTTLGENQLPYLIKGEARIVASSTLAFENGVVVKGHDSNGSNTGKLVVESGGQIFHGGGLADDLVFTSMHDDSIGGAVDTTTTTPKAGDWYGIVVEDGGLLDMRGFSLRYAGGRTTKFGDDKGGIKITGDTASSSIRNALIEKNYRYGIRLSDGAVLTIASTTLKDHVEKKTGIATALKIFDSTVVLQDVTFENNELDISAVGENYSVLADEATIGGIPTTEPEGLLE